MVVATFDLTNNQQINSTCLAFDQYLLQLKTPTDLNEHINEEVVFCVEHQILEELKYPQSIQDLDSFEHHPNDVYVFGLNTEQKLASVISLFPHPYRLLQIIGGKTLWAETAISIVLYDKWIKERK